MNRRHMSGDHHGRTARRATPLVTAADEILGTHKREDVVRAVRDSGYPARETIEDFRTLVAEPILSAPSGPRTVLDASRRRPRSGKRRRR